MGKKLCFSKRRITFFLSCVLLGSFFLLSFYSVRLQPLFVEYGVSKSTDICTKIMNKVIVEQFQEKIEEEIIQFEGADLFVLNFNTSILNSIAANAVNKAQIYFDMIEKGKINDELRGFLNFEEMDIDDGVTLKMPISRLFNNLFVSNIGLEIPVRYKFVSSLKAKIISQVEEYGINNALIVIKLFVTSDVFVNVPFFSEKRSVEFVIPILMKVIQGKVPVSYLGSNILGEVGS